MCPLLLHNNTRYQLPRSFFEKIIKKAEKSFPDLKKQAISLVMLGRAKMQELNKRYRKKNRPTDTISFAFNEGEKIPGAPMLGEIFLCPDYIRKHARTLNKSFHAEMRWIFVHSLLHLLGFDHQNKKQEAEMNALAEKILKN